MYLYIQKGVFLSSKWAFPKALKGVASKNFPGALPPDPHISLPPHFTTAGAAAAFNTPYGRYKFLRMPFGILSAAEIFQEKMIKAFEDIEGVQIIYDEARRKNLLAFACLFTFYACLFIFCACLFTFFLGANHKAPTFHVTLW